MRTTALTAAALLLLLSAAPRALADDPKAEPGGDLKKLQGTWTGKGGRDGQVKVTATFDGAKVAITGTAPDGQEFSMKGEVKLDESAKPHKTVDWVKFTRPDGTDAPANLGIYAFEGDDTVKFCNGGPGRDRPTEFKAGEDGPQIFVLTREKPAEVKGDLAKFQGDWTATVGPDKNIDIEIRFAGDAVTLKVKSPDGGEVEVKGKAVVDGDAKPHKTINWTKFTNPNGEEVQDNLGIYKFEGDDTVTVCSGGPGNERPTEFKAGDGGQPSLVTLKRVKK